MELACAALAHRVDRDAALLPPVAANRMVTVSLAAAFGLRHGLRTLREGRLLLGPSKTPRAMIEAMQRHAVGEVVTSPAVLANLVEEMELRPLALPKLESIITGGGPIAGATATAAARLFKVPVSNVYGSTETGLIGLATGESWFAQAGASGRVPPEITVEIVDEVGRTLPVGQEGEVRVKLDPAFTVAGYLTSGAGEEEAISAGWFYPGDLGRLSASRELTIRGRVTEVINTGGNKFAPERIEERLSKLPGVLRVAVVGIRGESGFDRIGIAIVRAPDVPFATIDAAMMRLPGLGRERKIVEVAALPLNEAGKIDRIRLKELFR